MNSLQNNSRFNESLSTKHTVCDVHLVVMEQGHCPACEKDYPDFLEGTQRGYNLFLEETLSLMSCDDDSQAELQCIFIIMDINPIAEANHYLANS